MVKSSQKRNQQGALFSIIFLFTLFSFGLMSQTSSNSTAIIDNLSTDIAPELMTFGHLVMSIVESVFFSF